MTAMRYSRPSLEPELFLVVLDSLFEIFEKLRQTFSQGGKFLGAKEDDFEAKI